MGRGCEKGGDSRRTRKSEKAFDARESGWKSDAAGSVGPERVRGKRRASVGVGRGDEFEAGGRQAGCRKLGNGMRREQRSRWKIVLDLYGLPISAY